MGKLYLKIIILLAILWFDTALAAPIIHSVITETNSIKIIGTAFGVKEPAAPILYENFENGNNGDAITNDNKWIKYPAGTNGGRYSNLQSFSGNLAAYNHIAPDGEFNTSNFFFNSSDEVYYSYRTRWTSNNVISGTRTVLKYGRINASPNRYNGAGNFAFSSGSALTGGGSYFFAENGAGGYLFQTYASVSKNNWHRVEMYEKLSQPAGAANGINWYALDGNVWNREQQVNRASGQTFKLDNIILGLMCANVGSSESVSIWVDDVYVDNTRSRIEIGDSINYNDCINKQIQLPTQWTENNIEATLNYSSFSQGSTAYLFVIDSDGVASNGFEITIGETGGSTVINPPTNLTTID